MRNGNGTMPRPALSGYRSSPAVTCSTGHLLIRYRSFNLVGGGNRIAKQSVRN